MEAVIKKKRPERLLRPKNHAALCRAREEKPLLRVVEMSNGDQMICDEHGGRSSQQCSAAAIRDYPKSG